MPELPDISVYVDALRARVVGRRLERIELLSPFLLRTAEPPSAAAEGTEVTAIERVGKRIAFELDRRLWLVLHLMIAGRLRYSARPRGRGGRNLLARLHFDGGVLDVTEAGSKKRASLHLVEGRKGLDALDPGGLEVLDAGFDAFRERLTLRNHTLKRALTDPHLFSGIGNAYSDEILHAARLSPIAQTQKLDEAAIARLHDAAIAVLAHWTEQLRTEAGDGFPAKVTAFRDGMAVHGRYRQPCPGCGTAVQRIRYAANEVNYCPRCQTGGRILADRALSRLLKQDWPRTIEALEDGGSSPAGLKR
ncbi:MAG: DNA-formamidopyrimidine glycosylase family protein [Gammaproteobacteria bacterium]